MEDTRFLQTPWHRHQERDVMRALYKDIIAMGFCGRRLYTNPTVGKKPVFI